MRAGEHRLESVCVRACEIECKHRTFTPASVLATQWERLQVGGCSNVQAPPRHALQLTH